MWCRGFRQGPDLKPLKDLPVFVLGRTGGDKNEEGNNGDRDSRHRRLRYIGDPIAGQGVERWRLGSRAGGRTNRRSGDRWDRLQRICLRPGLRIPRLRILWLPGLRLRWRLLWRGLRASLLRLRVRPGILRRVYVELLPPRPLSSLPPGHSSRPRLLRGAPFPPLAPSRASL